MHIKKLEVVGFKSFVDRTVIHFDHDVIGIVGPNGCGKSNIVDAIRWCMGEQSARHLRGKSMEDVIFNGSESRAQHGFAEVTLTFDNSDPEYAATLPLEYAGFGEIAVTRRLFRDGTSEYLINKTQVRLRDITELFLGTGVGTKAYSIVEQGRIGQIVSARPEDRRLFIEEAAGITKYKQRRKQAERKMDQTRQNLLRVSDIIAEIERTRTSLRRQAAKAERYIQYRQELEDLLLHQHAHRLLELIVVERVAREGLASTSQRSEALRAERDAEEEVLQRAREEASVIEQRTEHCAQEAFRADNAVAAIQAEIARHRDQLVHLDERLAAATREQETILQRLDSLGEEAAEIDARMTAQAQEVDERQQETEAGEGALADLRREELEATRVVNKLRDEVATLSKEAAALGAGSEALLRRMEDARHRRDRLARERETQQDEVSTLEARAVALRESVTQRAEGKRLSAEELKALEHELLQLRPTLREAERTLDITKNELGQRRNRLRALEDLHRRLEGVGKGVKALLGSGDATLRGMVADRLDVPEELIPALAALLGDRLHCVIVDDPQRGLALLDDLRRTRKGRATIVSARPAYVAGAGRRPLEPSQGVLGAFADLIGSAPGDEALVRSLLGETLVCHSTADALAAVRAHTGWTAVALDGTVVRPDGLISGGSGDDVAAAMVEQKREIRDLTELVRELDARAEREVDAHRSLRTRMTELEVAIDRARKGAHASELAHVSAEKDLTRTLSDLERVHQRLLALDRDLAELEASQRSTLAEEERLRAAVGDNASRQDVSRQAFAEAEATALTWKERVTGHATMVTERRVRLAQVREQLAATRSAAERVQSAIAELQTRSRRLEDDAHQAARSYGEVAAALLAAREGKGVGLDSARHAHTQHDAVRALLEEIRMALGTKDATLRELRIELVTVEDAMQKHRLEVQKLELEHRHLLEAVYERFRGLDLRRVVGDYHARPIPDAEHRRRADELAGLIDRMGPINLDAQKEFEDAEQRFVQLSAQKDDIERALTDLERAIKQMDRESRKRFRETFDHVNELFKATFARMFRGGRAELLLTSPDDLLETGVDIIAQPPGKKLGNIELMSGGEKALTATSLIFAIFQHRPSPFCVLDEVDAPLDEANVARYNEAIRTMTERSQFILITHIKATMQSVDVLYGVTMGEPGVSRLVSVKMNEAAKSRSERSGNALGSAEQPVTQVA